MEGEKESPQHSEVHQCQSSLKTGRSSKQGSLAPVSGVRPLKTGLNTSRVGDTLQNQPWLHSLLVSGF